jgi:hypothetical protein
MSVSRRRAEPNNAKIFPDLRRGASSTPCSHHLIPCQKYREFRPDPIHSAALCGAGLSEKSHSFRKVPVVFPVSRDLRGWQTGSVRLRPPPASRPGLARRRRVRKSPTVPQVGGTRSSLPRRLDGLPASRASLFAQSLWAQNFVSRDAVCRGPLSQEFLRSLGHDHINLGG